MRWLLMRRNPLADYWQAVELPMFNALDAENVAGIAAQIRGDTVHAALRDGAEPAFPLAGRMLQHRPCLWTYGHARIWHRTRRANTRARSLKMTCTLFNCRPVMRTLSFLMVQAG